MWELGVVMAALPADGQQQPDSAGQAARAVLPVFLMPVDAVVATYSQHWTPAAEQEARSKGRQPVALEGIERLLGNMGSRQDQVLVPCRLFARTNFRCLAVDTVTVMHVAAKCCRL